VNSATKENKEGLTAKVDVLTCTIKDKEETQGNAIINASVEEINILASNTLTLIGRVKITTRTLKNLIITLQEFQTTTTMEVIMKTSSHLKILSKKLCKLK
jgi:hypothetical protein